MALPASILRSTAVPPGGGLLKKLGAKVSFDPFLPKQLSEYKEQMKARKKTGMIVCRAIAAFEGDDDDLTFGANNLILVLDQGKSKDDWWEGVMDGRIGTFPGTFVTPMSYQPPDTSSFWFPPGMKPDEIEFAKSQRPSSPTGEEKMGCFLHTGVGGDEGNEEEEEEEAAIRAAETSSSEDHGGDGMDSIGQLKIQSTNLRRLAPAPPPPLQATGISRAPSKVNATSVSGGGSVREEVAADEGTIKIRPGRSAPPPPPPPQARAGAAPSSLVSKTYTENESSSSDEDPSVQLAIQPNNSVDVGKQGWLKKKGGGRDQAGRMQGNLFARRNWKQRLVKMCG